MIAADHPAIPIVEAALQDLEGAQASSPAAKRGPRLAWGIGLALVLLAAPLVGYRLMGTPEWLSLSREPTAEDRDVACSIQHGLASGANDFFEFGLFEAAIGHFHRTLAAALDAGG